MIKGTFSNVRANRCNASEISFQDFIPILKKPNIRKHKDGPLFTCSKFKDDTRSKENVIECSAAVLDFDNDGCDFPVQPAELCAELADFNHCYYTSFSNGKNGVIKWRLIVPFSRPLPREAAERATFGLWKFLGKPEGVDPRSYYPEQIWYYPACPPENQGIYDWKHVLGADGYLNTDELIELGKDYKRGQDQNALHVPDEVSRVPLEGPIPAGARNETLFKIGCYYRSLGLKQRDILMLLKGHNLRCEGQGLDEKELIALSTSAAKYKPGAVRPYEQMIEIAKELFGEPKREYISSELLFERGNGWESGFGKAIQERLRAELTLRTKVAASHVERYMFKLRDETPPEILIDFGVWDGRDYLAELCSHLNPACFSIEHTTELIKDFWAKAYQRIYDPLIQNRFLLLEGGQGIGKETFLHVMARPWGFYYIKPGDINQHQIKDTHQQLCKSVVIHIEEFDRIQGVNAGTLKDLITRDQITFRPPYERADVTKPVRSSWIGSCNTNSYLKDTTGSRRFLIIKLSGGPGVAIKFGYERGESFQRGLMAQIKHLGETGFRASKGAETALAEYQKIRTPEDEDAKLVEAFDMLAYKMAFGCPTARRVGHERIILKAPARNIIREICDLYHVSQARVASCLKNAGRDYRSPTTRAWVVQKVDSPEHVEGEELFSEIEPACSFQNGNIRIARDYAE